MIERRCRLRFLDEAATTALIGDAVGGQHFDRDVASQPWVPRAIDLAHAPGADQTENVVGAEPRTRLQGHVRGRIIRARRKAPAPGLCRSRCWAPVAQTQQVESADPSRRLLR